MTYPLNITDAGRALSKRGRARNDCTVRAMALVTRLAYDDAYDLLAKAGRKSGQKFDLRLFLKRQSMINGRKFIWENYPAEAGYPRMNISRFCSEKVSGTYICRSAKHVFAVIDGVAQDDHQTYDERCIYGAFRVEAA